ncbi:MAG: glyoxalase [Lachnospiraceae bacterium]|nr:glyoxalase [Lachnospiraceae bacterium]
MSTFQKEHLVYFLEHQDQLFDEPVAETIAEAEEFLEECYAEIFDSADDVVEYLEENGMDAYDIDELDSVAEVFKLPRGKYLVVLA